MKKQTTAAGTLSHKDLVALVGEDAALYLNQVPAEILVLIANGRIDAVQAAKEQLADRGLNTEGAWVGFKAAKQNL